MVCPAVRVVVVVVSLLTLERGMLGERASARSRERESVRAERLSWAGCYYLSRLLRRTSRITLREEAVIMLREEAVFLGASEITRN